MILYSKHNCMYTGMFCCGHEIQLHGIHKCICDIYLYIHKKMNLSLTVWCSWTLVWFCLLFFCASHVILRSKLFFACGYSVVEQVLAKYFGMFSRNCLWFIYRLFCHKINTVYPDLSWQHWDDKPTSTSFISITKQGGYSASVIIEIILPQPQ